MRVRKITDRIYYTEGFSETDRPVLGLILGANRTLMVDAGNSPRHALEFLQVVNAQRLPVPDFVAITHAHCDHIFGIQTLKRPTFANQLTRNRIRELQQLDWNTPAIRERVAQGREYSITQYMLDIEYPGRREHFIQAPDIVYDRMLELDLGGLHCLMETIGGDHAPDSSILYIPEEQVMFLGDCLYLCHVNEETVQPLFKKLLSYDATIYVDSHENEPITRVALTARYERSLLDARQGE
jgi:glyoxylase-like metal-dependent hydrolase (beta-lactamase superfamily II)